jgi:hypothetical protein
MDDKLTLRNLASQTRQAGSTCTFHSSSPTMKLCRKNGECHRQAVMRLLSYTEWFSPPFDLVLAFVGISQEVLVQKTPAAGECTERCAISALWR